MNNLFPSRRDFMNLNRNFFGDSFDNLFTNAEDFSVDIQDNDKSYKLEADLPGLNKEDIDLDYSNNVLSIRAKQETENKEEDEESNYVRRERSSRSFSRQFLIKDIDQDNITAKFENGVLTVDLPRTETEEPKTNKIDIQ